MFALGVTTTSRSLAQLLQTIMSASRFGDVYHVEFTQIVKYIYIYITG